MSVVAPLVVILASLIATAGAAMCVWGAAWQQPYTANYTAMQAEISTIDGPYRHVRNPRHLGLWLTIAAIAFLMPVTGAIVAMALLTLFFWRLILGEEFFLTSELGGQYRDYLNSVPRVIPRWWTSRRAPVQTPDYRRAALREVMPIGVFLTLACLGWSYNNRLLIQGVIVSFGLGLVARALVPAPKAEQRQAE